MTTIEPHEFEKKFRDFMSREMPGNEYQMAITYTDGKVDQNGALQVKTQVIGFDAKKVPFAIAHTLFRTLEMAVSGMLSGVYGPMMKKEENTPKEIGSSMHR